MIWIWSYEQWTWTKAIKEKIKFILHVQAHPDDNRKNNDKRTQERSGRLTYIPNIQGWRDNHQSKKIGNWNTCNKKPQQTSKEDVKYEDRENGYEWVSRGNLN